MLSCLGSGVLPLLLLPRQQLGMVHLLLVGISVHLLLAGALGWVRLRALRVRVAALQEVSIIPVLFWSRLRPALLAALAQQRLVVRTDLPIGSVLPWGEVPLLGMTPQLQERWSVVPLHGAGTPVELQLVAHHTDRRHRAGLFLRLQGDHRGATRRTIERTVRRQVRTVASGGIDSG